MQPRRPNAPPAPANGRSSGHGPAARDDRLVARYLLSVGLAAVGFLTLLVAFAVESYPRVPDPYYPLVPTGPPSTRVVLILFALSGALLLGALSSGVGLLVRRRAAAARGIDPVARG